MSRASAAALILVGCLLCACGGDDDGPGSVSAGKPNPKDAATDSGDSDAAAPLADAGSDAGPKPPKPPPDATPTCDDDACGLTSDECNAGVCNHDTGACELAAHSDGTDCGSSTSTTCTAADTCSAGTCVKNDAPEGTACAAGDGPCGAESECDGDGECVDQGLKPAGSSCGDQLTDTDCDAKDTCDAQGICQLNYAPEDQPCTDNGYALTQECKWNDLCDGSGHCVDQGYWETMMGHQCPMGRAHASGYGCSCGETVESECQYTDVCLQASCVPSYKAGQACNGGAGCCDDTGVCIDGVCPP